MVQYRARTSRRRSISMSKFRSAWVRAATVTMILYEYNIKEIREETRRKALERVNGVEEDLPEDMEEDEDDDGVDWDPDDSSVYLNINSGRRGTASLNLSGLTWAELLSVKAVVDLAFIRAAPAVRARDRKAKRDAQFGNIHPRLYRQLPEHVVRERIRYGYGQGVPVRSEDVLAGKITPEDFAGEFPVTSPVMAKRKSQDPGSQDSGETIDLDASLLEVGDQGDEQPPAGLPTSDSTDPGASSVAEWFA